MQTKPFLFHASLFTLALASALSLGACKKKTCTPLSCQAEGANCGNIVDSCGGISDCGVCSVAGETCGGLGPNLCGAGTCDPVTCVEKNVDCGLLEDGCGAVNDCGPCDGVVDGGGGPITGSGGAAGTGGMTSVGGTPGAGGAPTTGGAAGTGGAVVSDVVAPLGEGVMSGGGTSTNKDANGLVIRGKQYYFYFTNGWGPGLNAGSVNATWNGTSFKVSMSGSPGPSYEPVGFPAVFCGNYSDKVGETKCGLPIAIDTATQIKTGWRWASNGNSGQYNASYDIWLGSGSTLESYLMVWLRDPPGQQPAGSKQKSGITTSALPGSWDIWAGSVNGHPIINYVKAEGQDISEIEFDVKALVADARAQGVGNLPGAQVNSVAVGFETWNNVTNVETIDFYVDAK